MSKISNFLSRAFSAVKAFFKRVTTVVLDAAVANWDVASSKFSDMGAVRFFLTWFVSFFIAGMIGSVVINVVCAALPATILGFLLAVVVMLVCDLTAILFGGVFIFLKMNAAIDMVERFFTKVFSSSDHSDNISPIPSAV